MIQFQLCSYDRKTDELCESIPVSDWVAILILSSLKLQLPLTSDVLAISNNVRKDLAAHGIFISANTDWFLEQAKISLTIGTTNPVNRKTQDGKKKRKKAA